MSSKVNVRTPNPEQIQAIVHTGGKILSAGAGSGKTFVIIEHIIHKLLEFKKTVHSSDLEYKLPFFLPRLVLMTFTNKAAGEMSIRLMNKVDELYDHSMDENKEDLILFWDLIRQNLNRINVTTISAFCKQIISQGYIEDVPKDVEILSEVEFKNKITGLYNDWFNLNSSKLETVFKANNNAIINGMIEIFSSPELRSLWKNPLKKTSATEELNHYLENYLKQNDLEDIFRFADLNASASEQDKPWFVFLDAFNSLVSSQGRIDASNFLIFVEFAKNQGTKPRAVKAMSEAQKAQLARAWELVSFLRSPISEDFKAFVEHYETYWKWVEVLANVYQYIDQNYLKIPGFNFSDIEYYVFEALKIETICEKVVSNYSYVIVDEFQDTSFVQFEIIKSLINGELNKLFCVGDIKQAIYGFRGGEITVFKECIKLLGDENKLELKFNFRSSGNVIHFNNVYFEDVFKMGVGFKNDEDLSVLMQSQTIPDNKINTGHVEQVSLVLEEGLKINKDQVEAQALFYHINELLLKEDINEVCVLYKNLSPSNYLVELLTKENKTFSAQVKLSFNEDPMINLFNLMIEIKLNQKNAEKLERSRFQINNLLKVIGAHFNIQDIEQEFVKNVDIMGLRLAFHKTVYALGISNSLYFQNSTLIDSICNLTNENLIATYTLLEKESGQRYSINLRNGNEKKIVTIMTAHASKGLEFDAVCLGGIYSNGREIANTDLIGKLPGSLRWKKVFNQKKFNKSPLFYYETDFEKRKSFDESKRLFYVACTRAVKHLSWINILQPNKKGEITSVDTETSSSSHWIKAFKSFLGLETIIINKEININELYQFKQNLSLLQKDNLGLGVTTEDLGLGLMAETSVTKLAHLGQCPFKFYLSNICKIEPEAPSFILSDEVDDEVGERIVSSKDRGTKIHSYLSDILTGTMELDKSPIHERKNLEWVYLKSLEHAKEMIVVSEKLIKFSFFGQMLTGTPDIVFHNEKNLVVWDFKTGARHIDNEEHYWFQLFCYAYAYGKLKHFVQEKMITVSLVYLDTQELVSKELSLAEIEHYLFENWKKTKCLNQVNHSHCKHCEYREICHFSTNTSSS